MSNEELDSQLSAMFDDELSQAECELLARRLARDPQLKARWGRYALIGAAVRAERDVKLDTGVARRVNAALVSEPALEEGAEVARRPRNLVFPRWQQALAGGAVAAAVAAVSIFLLRAQNTDQLLVAGQSRSEVAPAAIVARSEPDSYTVPTVAEPPSIIPSAELANYVVAHSEFSTPLVRRNTLSTLMASDAAADETGDEAQPADLVTGSGNAQSR